MGRVRPGPGTAVRERRHFSTSIASGHTLRHTAGGDRDNGKSPAAVHAARGTVPIAAAGWRVGGQG